MTNDQKIALQWMEMVESDKSKVRDDDIYPRLKKWAVDPGFKDILEIGCGQGVCSKHLGLIPKNYTGIDTSEFLIERAEKLYSSPHKKFLQAHASSLPFKNSSFDGVYLISVMHLLEDLPLALAEIHRVLRPEGRFLMMTANPHAYSLWTNSYANGDLKGSRFEGRKADIIETLHLHSMDYIKENFQSAHLEIQVTEEFRNKLYLQIEGRKLGAVEASR